MIDGIPAPGPNLFFTKRTLLPETNVVVNAKHDQHLCFMGLKFDPVDERSPKDWCHSQKPTSLRYLPWFTHEIVMGQKQIPHKSYEICVYIYIYMWCVCVCTYIYMYSRCIYIYVFYLFIYRYRWPYDNRLFLILLYVCYFLTEFSHQASHPAWKSLTPGPWRGLARLQQGRLREAAAGRTGERLEGGGLYAKMLSYGRWGVGLCIYTCIFIYLYIYICIHIYIYI